jgi:hypothetical protein
MQLRCAVFVCVGVGLFSPAVLAQTERDANATSCEAGVGRTPDAQQREDSRSLVFDDSMLFAVHRTPSYDRLPESATRGHQAEPPSTPGDAGPQREPRRC